MFDDLLILSGISENSQLNVRLLTPSATFRLATLTSYTKLGVGDKAKLLCDCETRQRLVVLGLNSLQDTHALELLVEFPYDWFVETWVYFRVMRLNILLLFLIVGIELLIGPCLHIVPIRLTRAIPSQQYFRSRQLHRRPWSGTTTSPFADGFVPQYVAQAAINLLRFSMAVARR